MTRHEWILGDAPLVIQHTEITVANPAEFHIDIDIIHLLMGQVHTQTVTVPLLAHGLRRLGSWLVQLVLRGKYRGMWQGNPHAGDVVPAPLWLIYLKTPVIKDSVIRFSGYAWMISKLS
jgi:hypothetical protein